MPMSPEELSAWVERNEPKILAFPKPGSPAHVWRQHRRELIAIIDNMSQERPGILVNSDGTRYRYVSRDGRETLTLIG